MVEDSDAPPSGAADAEGRVLCHGDLVEALHVAPSLEGRREPGVQDPTDLIRLDEAPTERDDVQIVVSPRHPGALHVVAGRGSDSAHLVRRNGHADPRPTEQDAAVGVPQRDRTGDLQGEVRIVHPLLREGPEVLNLDPLFLQEIQHGLLQDKTGVITPNSCLHQKTTSTKYPAEALNGAGRDALPLRGRGRPSRTPVTNLINNSTSCRLGGPPSALPSAKRKGPEARPGSAKTDEDPSPSPQGIRRDPLLTLIHVKRQGEAPRAAQAHPAVPS